MSSPYISTYVSSVFNNRLGQASTCTWIDHLVSGLFSFTFVVFTTLSSNDLSLRKKKNCWPIMQKVQEYFLFYTFPCTYKKLSLNISKWFQVLFTHKSVLFHLSLTVLLHYRTIKKVLVLVGGPTFLQLGFHVSQFTPNFYSFYYYRTCTF